MRIVLRRLITTALFTALCVRAIASITLLASGSSEAVGKANQAPARNATPNGRARTVVYHAGDLVALRAKLHYTTLIVLPEGEEVVEATCGDKEFWLVNARDGRVSLKPTTARSETNLNLVTSTGQIYSFIVTEITDLKGGGLPDAISGEQKPDLVVFLEQDEGAAATMGRARRQYVPAQQVEDFRAQATAAREEARRASEVALIKLDEGLTAFRGTYPISLAFPYRFDIDRPPFFVHAIFHDDHRTFIQAHPQELPSLYELTDSGPSLVNFDVREGTYVVPKVLDSGYLMLGKRRFVFKRASAR